MSELTLLNLTTKLRPVTAWHDLGLQLKVPSYELEKIELNFPKVDRRMHEVLNYWWRNCPTERRSWQTIADALKLINYRNLAKEIENESPDGRDRQVTKQNTTVTRTSDHTLTHRIPASRSKVVSDDSGKYPVTFQPSSNGSKSKWCGWQWTPVLIVGLVVLGIVAFLWTQCTPPPPVGGTINVEDRRDGALDLTDSIFTETPKMTELHHLELPKPGKALYIAEMIGRSYMKVGGELLEDSSGNMVENIWTDNRHEVTDTNREILRMWLEGGGKQPVNWRTLIQVLEKHGKVELARDIRKALLYRHGVM